MNNFDKTENRIKELGYLQLSGEELRQKIENKTIWGDYYNGRKYISYSDKDGNIEGRNDLGSHVFGKWLINKNDNTFEVKWDGYWEDWTGRAYDVDGKIQFFDTTSLNWRTTFNKFEIGKKTLVL